MTKSNKKNKDLVEVKKHCRNPNGVPRKEIDIKAAQNMCALQCTSEEIAGVFDIDNDTLIARLKEHGYPNFSEFFKKYSASGKVSLRRHQWKLAEAGNATMLVWLGKNILGQTDKTESEITTRDVTPDRPPTIINHFIEDKSSDESK
jgi:hypothetical protein